MMRESFEESNLLNTGIPTQDKPHSESNNTFSVWLFDDLKSLFSVEQLEKRLENAKNRRKYRA